MCSVYSEMRAWGYISMEYHTHTSVMVATESVGNRLDSLLASEPWHSHVGIFPIYQSLNSWGWISISLHAHASDLVVTRTSTPDVILTWDHGCQLTISIPRAGSAPFISQWGCEDIIADHQQIPRDVWDVIVSRQELDSVTRRFGTGFIPAFSWDYAWKRLIHSISLEPELWSVPSSLRDTWNAIIGAISSNSWGNSAFFRYRTTTWIWDHRCSTWWSMRSVTLFAKKAVLLPIVGDD